MYKFTVKDEGVGVVDQLKLLFIRGIFWSSNLVLALVARLLYSKNQNPSRILIFRTGSLGDNLCAIPSIAAINKAYPNAQIDILTNAGKSNLVGLNKILDPSMYHTIIDYLGMSKKELIKLLRKNKYDLVIQLPQTDAPFLRLLRDLFFFRYITSSGFGWQYSTIRIFRKAQEKFIRFPNETERIAQIVEQKGIPVDRAAYSLHFDTNDLEAIDRIWSSDGLAKKRNIGLVVGAKRPQNRWPISYFKELIEFFQGEYNFLLVGGPEDKALTASINKLPFVFDYCGSFTPIQSAILLSKCDVVVSNDTGPMHLSYAVSTPLIALFSSRDFPGKWFPPDKPENVIFRSENIHCSLCLSENCTNNICLQAIKPAAVAEALRKKLTVSV